VNFDKFWKITGKGIGNGGVVWLKPVTDEEYKAE
jgi:hypothetical protein